ncbi:MAG: MBL fold metallo-hydrolase [Lachnospiraceae bacterium]|nr:MBL fold metallo-hydrolase [Lachnospiraceae bacterium]
MQLLNDKYGFEKIVVPFVDTNCYVLSCGKEALLIDAGGDGSEITSYMKNNKLKLTNVLITHGHYDHIEALDNILKEFKDVKIFASINEKGLINDKMKSLMDHELETTTQNAITYLEDNAEFKIFDLDIKMINTPGHTAGCVCYYLSSLNILFSGDTLFKDTYGRTDLPTSNTKDIVISISKKLMELPDDTKVYPGHGRDTTIGYERENSEIMRDYVINWAINN